MKGRDGNDLLIGGTGEKLKR
ncbi:MAG: hypothetical protein ABI614_22465 [Planctomycetota bacterium]